MPNAETPTATRNTEEQLVQLARVADIAAQCMMDLDANLKSANEEYMEGKIPRGAFEYVLSRHTALHIALHEAGYTAKHPIFEFPVKPD